MKILRNPNTVSTNKNTASSNKSLKTKVKESIPTKVKTVIQKVKNKFKKISKKLTPKKLKSTSKNKSRKKELNDLYKLQSSSDSIELYLQENSGLKSQHKSINKKVSSLDKFYGDEFIEKLINNGFSEEKAKKISEMMEELIKELEKIPKFEYVVVILENGEIVVGTDYNETGVDPRNHWTSEELNKIKYMIHNHPFETTPLPSAGDLETYAEFGIEESMSFSNDGLIQIINESFLENKLLTEDIVNVAEGIEKEILLEFKRCYGVKYDENNKGHVSKINSLIRADLNKYLELYNKKLERYNIIIKYIN